MRKVKKWRYYCDFCKKSGAAGGHIAKHERGCTKNPGRECGMCKIAKLEQKPVAELLAALNDGGLPAVTELAQHCPACILSAIHALRLIEPLTPPDRETGDSNYIDFDFRTASTAFWADVRESEEPYY